MSQQRDGLEEMTGGGDAGDATRDNQENELAAEQESAEAMDADVPHSPDTSEADAG